MNNITRAVAWLPKLSAVRNEIVAWAGLVLSAGGAAVVFLTDIDFTSPEGILMTLGPAATNFSASMKSYGAVTYEKAVAEASRRA